MKKRGITQKNWLLKRYLPIKNTGIGILAILFCISTSQAQVKTPTVDVHKLDVHFSVGKAIETEETKKALEVISEIKGVEYTMHRYNERFGNDSVRAVKFVDRDPDTKADDPILKNYYNVVVGADSLTMVHTWFTFLVKNDFKEVLYYDMKKGKTMPIDDWKKIWPASEFLRDKTD